MAASGYTPISLYYSTTASAAPTAGNLVSGELAINITDGKLYYKDNAGAVQLLSTSTTATGTANGVLYLNGSKVATSGSALYFNGTSLGVGTTSPVFSNSGQGVMINGTTAGTVRVTQGGGTQAGEFRADSSHVYIGSRTNGSLIFEQFGSEAMRLTSTGLGIGTSSPAAILATTKSSSTQATGLLLRNPDGTTGSSISIDFETSLGTSGTEAAMAGRIAGVRTGSGTSGALTFSTTNAGTLAERARIDSSGNLLVGTTSQITGEKFAADTTGASAKAITARNNAGSGAATIFVWNSATSGDNLFMGFGTEANGAQRGSISYNRTGGLTAYNTTSDYRAKDITGPVENSGALIDSVPVYMGKMKGATQERPMFIAHETPAYAHTGVKDAVDAEGNPVYQQMDASALIPVMWAEIQSLRARVAALES